MTHDGTTNDPHTTDEHHNPSDPQEPTGWEEARDYARRVQLGLRPVHYEKGHTHPDTRPCPAWCQLADGAEPHGVKAGLPADARHASWPIETLASQYVGVADEFGTSPATLRTVLHRRGVNDPAITVQLDATINGQVVAGARRLTLSLDDAQELSTVLQYLLAQADAAELLDRDSGDVA